MIDNAMSAVFDYHVEAAGGKYFETGYNSTLQNSIISRANSGNGYSSLISYAYNNKTLGTGLNTGTVSITSYTGYVGHP